MSEKRRLVTNTLANGAAQVVAMLAALVFMPFLVRAFGLNDYGLYILASSVNGYTALLDFGVGTSLTKMIAEMSAHDDREGVARLVSSALAFYVIIGIVIASILVAMGVFASTLFHVTPEGARLLRNIFFVSAIFQLWSWPASTAAHVLGGFQRYTFTARVNLGLTVGTVASIGIVLATKQGPVVLTALTGIVGVIATIATILLARRELHGTRVSLGRAGLPQMKRIFAFSWALFVIQVATVIVYQQTDRLVLGVFVGASAVALYEAAGKFQGFTSQLTGFVTSAVLPMASKLDAEGRHSSLKTLFIRGSKYSAALIAPVVVTLVVLADGLILRWLGPSFGGQALAARILVFPQLLMALGPVGDLIITGQGKLPLRLPYTIAITLGNLVLSLALVRPFGILGVVIGTALPYVLEFPLHVRFLLKHTGVSLVQWMREVILPVYPLLLVPVGLTVAGRFTPLFDSLAGLAVLAVSSIAAYWLALLMAGLNDSERAEVKSALAFVRERLRTGRR